MDVNISSEGMPVYIISALQQAGAGGISYESLRTSRKRLCKV
jgi:hypothetical protein